ncbi:plasmid replication initiation protein [Paraburkholderia atlantica]|uniref:hypothetical protein n=1 Tax=Paraburkholderia atlantica TaxID=2654982 RepID=UPI003D20A3EC
MEMFAQYRDTGLVRISFDDFCHAMEAPPSCLKDFGQLRRRVIDPAVAELTGKDGLLIEWTPVWRQLELPSATTKIAALCRRCG